MYIPDHWYDFIARANKKNPFTVIKMQREDFFGSPPLEEKSTLDKKTCIDGKATYWQKYSNVLHDADNNTVSLKNPYGNLQDQPNVCIPLLYKDCRKISTEKFNDLSKMLRFIPDEYHSFYTSLKHSNIKNVKDYALDSSQSSEDEQDSIV